MHVRWLLLLLTVIPIVFPSTMTQAADCSFKNPILSLGQDPSVVFHDGAYYLVQSSAGKLTITRSETIPGLGSAAPVTVYTPPTGQPYSYDMWAPELVLLDGRWYIYVAATSSPGNNATHRMYALQADTEDALGSWTMMGKVADPTDKWAIDGTVFEYEGQLYMVWSGWPGDVGDFPQNLYIAAMSDPLTISGERYLLSEPDQPWETSVAALQEGPEAFIHDGQLSIVYSGNASWTPRYNLGLLKLVGDDPLDHDSWEKVGPVFTGHEDQDSIVYGVGHNSMPVTSPDGRESWLIYHVKTVAREGWDDRAIHAQPFSWNDDGTPNFGRAVSSAETLPLPSGEPCGEIAGSDSILTTLPETLADGVLTLDNTFVDSGRSWINTLGSYSVAVSVRLDATGSPMALVSQDGGIVSNFSLEYTGEVFAFCLNEAFGQERVCAQSTVRPEAGQWVHLVAVRNAATGEASLFVDGEQAATATFGLVWGARGNLIIGAARESSQRVKPLSGAIRDLRLYNGVLNATEVAALFDPQA